MTVLPNKAVWGLCSVLAAATMTAAPGVALAEDATAQPAEVTVEALPQDEIVVDVGQEAAPAEEVMPQEVEALSAEVEPLAAQTIDPLPAASPEPLPEDYESPEGENSWRYGEQAEELALQNKNVEAAAKIKANPLQEYAIAPLALNFHVSKEGNNYVATFGGGTMTVTNAHAFGVDVSEHNGSNDWQRAKADGVDFAILRLGWGSYDEANSTDRFFKENYYGARDAGIKIGIYLYSYAGWRDDGNDIAFWENYAWLEADHVIRVLQEMGIGPNDLEYPIYYDIEEQYLANPLLHYGYGTQLISNNEFIARIAKIFCDHISEAGYEVGIYSSTSWWNNYLTDPVFDNWERWVARYPYYGVYGQGSQYEGTHAMWQAHSEAWVDGIGTSDINFDYRTDRTRTPEPAQPEEPVNPEPENPNPENPNPESPTPSNPGETENPNPGESNPGESQEELTAYFREEHPEGSIFRLYNPYTGAHHFTADPDEAIRLVSEGMTNEYIGWTAPTDGALTNVYRLFNPYSKDHHYTTSVIEYHTLEKCGWDGEGKAFSSGGDYPIYRLFNPYLTEGTHLYTTSESERDARKAEGWIDEGIAFYAKSIS